MKPQTFTFNPQEVLAALVQAAAKRVYMQPTLVHPSMDITFTIDGENVELTEILVTLSDPK